MVAASFSSCTLAVASAASAGASIETMATWKPWRRRSSPSAAKGPNSRPEAGPRPSVMMNSSLMGARSSASLLALNWTASTSLCWSPGICG